MMIIYVYFLWLILDWIERYSLEISSETKDNKFEAIENKFPLNTSKEIISHHCLFYSKYATKTIFTFLNWVYV